MERKRNGNGDDSMMYKTCVNYHDLHFLEVIKNVLILRSKEQLV